MMPAPAQIVQPPQYVPQPVDTTTTTVTTTVEPQSQPLPSKYSCASCGKFRSARYHYRHPLATGETPRPTLCRKCVKQHTSSEESDEVERTRWKKKQQEARRRRRHRSHSSDEWSSSSSQEDRRKHHRYRSGDDGRRQHRSTPSSSGTSTKIYIIRRFEERQRPEARRRQQPSSSSENVRITRSVRINRDRPRPILRSRYRYGPYDGHYSHEEYLSDLEVEDDDYFEPRGRSRSRSRSRHSVDGSHSYDEDEYVRISTTHSQRRPLSLLDRLTGSRSRSRSRSRSGWRGERSVSHEDELVRISIRSREPSPLQYERREEYEERMEESHRSPWGRQSDSMLVHRDSTIETRSDDHFDHPRGLHSRHVHGSRQLEGRSFGFRSPERSVRMLRVHSPEPFGRRRRSLDHGSAHLPRVRFARSASSHREEHRGPHEPHHRRRHRRLGSNLSFSDEENFHSAGRCYQLYDESLLTFDRKSTSGARLPSCQSIDTITRTIRVSSSLCYP